MAIINDDGDYALQLHREEVEIMPGRSVLVRAITAEELVAIQGEIKDDDSPQEVQWPLLLRACVKEDGSPLFASVERVKRLPGGAAIKLQQAAVRLSGVGGDERKNS